MLKQILDYGKQLLSLTRDTQQNKTDIKELKRGLIETRQEIIQLQREFTDLTHLVERLAAELHHDRENAAKDHENLLLRLENTLLPLLRKAMLPNPFDPIVWSESLLQECKDACRIILPFESNELAFLDHLLDEGEINPELLTEEQLLQERIQNHPDLAWKALNVKKFRAGNNRG